MFAKDLKDLKMFAPGPRGPVIKNLALREILLTTAAIQ